MPGFNTHYLFGADAYKRISSVSIRKQIARHHHAYALGLQGPDLFFYDLPAYFINPRNIGNVAHEEKTGEFFTALLEGRMLLAGKKDSEDALAIADAYICGFVGHYTLDCNTHPFVYAFTKYDPYHPRDAIENFGQHVYLETELDNSLLWLRKHIMPSKFHENVTIQLSAKETRVIGKILAYAYHKTWPEYHMSEFMVRDATRWMRTGTKLVNDPSGQKKVMVRFFEQKILKKPMISPMLPSDRYWFAKDPLNMSKRTWRHPWTHEATNATFLDLYNIAGQIYDKRITDYYALVDSGYDISLQEKFIEDYGSLSFLSGNPVS